MVLLTFVVSCHMVFSPFEGPGGAPMAESTLKDLIRGDMPLARVIFKDPRKRRLIQQLQQDGWPIFDLAGKRCAFPADIAAHMRKATRSGPARRGATKRKIPAVA